MSRVLVERIRTGHKWMEARVRSGHFRDIGVGKVIRFGDSAAARITVVVVEVLYCKDFDDMFRALRVKPAAASWEPFLPDCRNLREGKFGKVLLTILSPVGSAAVAHCEVNKRGSELASKHGVVAMRFCPVLQKPREQRANHPRYEIPDADLPPAFWQEWWQPPLVAERIPRVGYTRTADAAPWTDLFHSSDDSNVSCSHA